MALLPPRGHFDPNLVEIKWKDGDDQIQCRVVGGDRWYVRSCKATLAVTSDFAKLFCACYIPLAALNFSNILVPGKLLRWRYTLPFGHLPNTFCFISAFICIISLSNLLHFLNILLHFPNSLLHFPREQRIEAVFQLWNTEAAADESDEEGLDKISGGTSLLLLTATGQMPRHQQLRRNERFFSGRFWAKQVIEPARPIISNEMVLGSWLLNYHCKHLNWVRWSNECTKNTPPEENQQDHKRSHVFVPIALHLMIQGQI